MPKKKERSPIEKKKLSYAKDRVNTYGENDKSSRKAIPLRKKLANSQVRQADKRNLKKDFEEIPLTRKKPSWRKEPDTTLGAHLEGKLTEVQSQLQDHNISQEVVKDRLLRMRLVKFLKREVEE